MENFDKRMNKKTGEELQQYLAFRRKAGRVPSKKGKGSYDRKAFKKGAQKEKEKEKLSMDNSSFFSQLYKARVNPMEEIGNCFIFFS